MKITRMRNEEAGNTLFSMVDKQAIVVIYEAYLEVFNEKQTKKAEKRSKKILSNEFQLEPIEEEIKDDKVSKFEESKTEKRAEISSKNPN